MSQLLFGCQSKIRRTVKQCSKPNDIALPNSCVVYQYDKLLTILLRFAYVQWLHVAEI